MTENNLYLQDRNFYTVIDTKNKSLTIQVTITPVAATREIIYDISNFIKAYLDMGKTEEEEAREDFKKILKEVVDELSEMRGFKND